MVLNIANKRLYICRIAQTTRALRELAFLSDIVSHDRSL